MEPGLIWILAGLLLLAAELALPGIFLLWVGLAAIGTGILVLAVLPPFEAVVAIFLALLAGGVMLALDHPNAIHGLRFSVSVSFSGLRRALSRRPRRLQTN